MNPSLAKTPLYDWHVKHGGRMVDFAGWEMPIQYSSIIEEHRATRSAVGLFDISHMGRLRFDGPRAGEYLDSLVTRRVASLAPGKVAYSLVTNDEGGILDDVLVYHLQDATGGSYWMVVCNASNRPKLLSWLEQHPASDLGVVDSDLTEPWSMIAVQGPQAIELAQPLVEVDIPAMKYYTAAETMVAGHGGIVSRTGYTGEDGVELIVGAAVAESIWETLADGGAKAAGLGARDTLRLEAAMPLYGHELDENTNPIEAGLGFAVNVKDRTFPGRDVLARLKDEPPARVRVGLVTAGKRVPREGCPLVSADGSNRVGVVTSGSYSPTLDKPIAMGYVQRDCEPPGTELAVDIRGRLEPATVVELPFYRR